MKIKRRPLVLSIIIFSLTISTGYSWTRNLDDLRKTIEAEIAQSGAEVRTGSISGMEHDAAIVFPPVRKPYVLVVLTRGVKSAEEGEELISRLSRLIYSRLS